MTTRNLIAIILLLIAGLPLIVSSWLSYRGEWRRGESERDQHLSQRSREISMELRRRIDVALENARADGSIPGLAELIEAESLSTEQRLLANRYLTAIKGRDPLNITDVALIDNQGRVRAASASGEVGRDRSDQPYVRTVLRLGLPQLIGPLRSDPDSEPALYVAAPVRGIGDEAVGLLRVSYQPALLAQVLHAELREGSGLGAVLLDQHSRVLATTGMAGDIDLLSGSAVSSPHDIGDGATPYRAIAAVVPRVGWRLLVFEPSGVRAMRQEQLTGYWLFQVGGLALLLGGAAWLIGGLIARPVVRLTRSVDAIAEGDLDRRVEAGGSRELRRLGEAVNALNQRLARNLDSLSQELQQRSEAENSLRESENRLSMLIEQIPGTVYRCAYDADWTMVFLGSQIEQLTGYPADALLQNRRCSFASLIHPEDVGIVSHRVSEAIGARRPFELLYRLFHRDGSLRWVWERGQAHFNEQGEVQWLDGVLFDVSEKQRAEQSLAALRASTEDRTGGDYFASLSSVLSTSQRLRCCLIAQRRADRSLQLLSATLDGQPADETALLGLQPACATVAAGATVVVADELQQRYPNQAADAPAFIGFVGLPLRDRHGEVIGVLAVAHDRRLSDPLGLADLLALCAPRAVAEIERSDAQQALQALAAQLEQRVIERTADLEASHRQLSIAMEQIVQSEKLASLGSLVAGIAHELNTPIGNALTASTSLQALLRSFQREFKQGQLRKSTLTRFIAEGDEAGELIERNLHRAAELIGHFKQVAVDQTSARRRSFDLRTTVNEVLTTLRPRLKRLPHRIEVEVPEGIELDSYPGPFEQVLTNLVSNSLDHAFPEGRVGCIRIQARYLHDCVEFAYQDDGVGIPAELQKRVFDPFYTTRLGSGGSGLGLYLVYSLVTGILGGSLDLHSSEGQGLRVRLQLPVRAPDPRESTEAGAMA